MNDEVKAESFADFKNSFFYGSRSDLTFKFLKSFSDADAADFIQQLFAKIGDAMDSGDFMPVIDHVYEGQAEGFREQKDFAYGDGPFTKLAKPLAESKLALLTSSGHFVDGDDPKPFGIENISQEELMSRLMDLLKEAPTLSAIPVDTPPEKLRVRHVGYDMRAVRVDPNVAFPLDRLRELASEKLYGELASPAYSFMGACAQTRLLKRNGPEWVERMKAENIEAALLVPV